MNTRFTDTSKQHIFIVGCKGIPSKYGGFETFVEKLTEYNKNDNLVYHVAGIRDSKEYSKEEREYEHNSAHCFALKEKMPGPSRAIFYDIDAIKYCIKYIKKYNIPNPIVYVLACRIGPFVGKYKKQLAKLGGKLYVNPDGHEWKRAKWSAPVRAYWKLSEKLMVKHADLLICDSIGIEKYIKEDYKEFNPNTVFISYGAETSKSTFTMNTPEVKKWFKQFRIKPKNYYLIVGRFVPENNFYRMIKEFKKSKTKKDLVIITHYKGEKLYEQLQQEIDFKKDGRIKFVGTVYNEQLLKIIREEAYGYLHGHSVGGTNPSLLEALGQTDLNLLYDVVFNKEVAKEGALYWTHEYGDLARMIEEADAMKEDKIAKISARAKKRVDKYYSWEYITRKYEELFTDNNNVTR